MGRSKNKRWGRMSAVAANRREIEARVAKASKAAAAKNICDKDTVHCTEGTEGSLPEPRVDAPISYRDYRRSCETVGLKRNFSVKTLESSCWSLCASHRDSTPEHETMCDYIRNTSRSECSSAALNRRMSILKSQFSDFIESRKAKQAGKKSIHVRTGKKKNSQGVSPNSDLNLPVANAELKQGETEKIDIPTPTSSTLPPKLVHLLSFRGPMFHKKKLEKLETHINDPELSLNSVKLLFSIMGIPTDDDALANTVLKALQEYRDPKETSTETDDDDSDQDFYFEDSDLHHSDALDVSATATSDIDDASETSSSFDLDDYIAECDGKQTTLLDTSFVENEDNNKDEAPYSFYLRHNMGRPHPSHFSSSNEANDNEPFCDCEDFCLDFPDESTTYKFVELYNHLENCSCPRPHISNVDDRDTLIDSTIPSEEGNYNDEENRAAEENYYKEKNSYKQEDHPSFLEILKQKLPNNIPKYEEEGQFDDAEESDDDETKLLSPNSVSDDNDTQSQRDEPSPHTPVESIGTTTPSSLCDDDEYEWEPCSVKEKRLEIFKKLQFALLVRHSIDMGTSITSEGMQPLSCTVLEAIFNDQNRTRCDDKVLNDLGQPMPCESGEKIIYSHNLEGSFLTDKEVGDALFETQDDEFIESLYVYAFTKPVMELIFKGLLTARINVDKITSVHLYIPTREAFDMMKNLKWANLSCATFVCSRQLNPYSLMTFLMCLSKLNFLELTLLDWTAGSMRMLHSLYPFVHSLQTYKLTWKYDVLDEDSDDKVLFYCQDCQNCRYDPSHEFHQFCCPTSSCKTRLLPLFNQRQPLDLDEMKEVIEWMEKKRAEFWEKQG